LLLWREVQNGPFFIGDVVTYRLRIGNEDYHVASLQPAPPKNDAETRGHSITTLNSQPPRISAESSAATSGDHRHRVISQDPGGKAIEFGSGGRTGG
jgi:hypothetical protein